MENKFLTLLGFARKANNLTSGDEGVKNFLKQDKIHLLILAQDYSEKRKAYWRKVAEELGIDIIEQADKESLGRAIGTSPRALVGILDEKMAETLKNIVS